MPLIVNVSKASFTISGPEYEPTGAEALRTEDDRRYWWGIFGEWCLRAKRKELFTNQDVKGEPFKPIKYKRPDGAKGPPLSPHQRASRFQKWARKVATSRQVTLFWSHGWAKVVGAHAFPRVRAAGWKLPKRDAVGLTPASLRWAFGMTLGAWRHRIGTGPAKLTHVVPPVGPPASPLELPTLRPRLVPKPKPKPKPKPRPKLEPKPRPEPKPASVPAAGMPILPGRPIAERLAAYAEGDRITAAMADHHRAYEEAEAARIALAKRRLELDRMQMRGKLTPALQKEQDRTHKQYQEAELKALKLKAREHVLLIDHLKATEPLKVAIRPGRITGHRLGNLDPPSADLQKAIDRAADWLGVVLRRGNHATPDVEVGAGMQPKDWAQRAFYNNEIRAMALPEKTSPTTVVHEFGHAMDERMGLFERSMEFLAHRVGSEPARPLLEVFPNAAYEAWEKGRKDRFDEAFGAGAWYVGKDYGAHRYCEVLPMGLEKLYENPAQFAAKDPEYFKWIVGIVRGELR